MKYSVGFIGTGNMGTPMIKSLAKSGLVDPGDICIFDVDTAKMGALQKEHGVTALKSGKEVVQKADMIILAVKPHLVRPVLEDCKGGFSTDKLLVAIAAGLPIKLYKEILGSSSKVVRTMPNTPAQVGEGMTLICCDNNITGEETEKVKAVFSCFGKVEMLDEKLMSEVIALTSSSPAYVFMFIEAMADAAVLSGIPRDKAYRLAAQAVMGSAKMVLETGKHPGELKDQVCSPAGTTIEAVAALEKNGFRHAIIEAMNECTKKAREIGKQGVN